MQFQMHLNPFNSSYLGIPASAELAVGIQFWGHSQFVIFGTNEWIQKHVVLYCSAVDCPSLRNLTGEKETAQETQKGL